MKKWLLIPFIVLSYFQVFAQTPYVMSGGNYSQDFSDISNWGNGFVSGIGASNWSSVAVNSTGIIPDGVKITTTTATFATGTSGGVQKGTGNIILLSTGSTDNSSASAIDLLLDFTGRTAGTISFDWASVNNSTGNRNGSLRIYTSTNGTIFTELTSAQVLNFTNNVLTSGSISTVSLPASLNNSSTARIRFYYCNGTGGATGSRPKISVDNITVTSTSINSAPTAASVSFSGNLIQGQILTGSYIYSDSENDPEGTSTFKWYRSDDASGTGKVLLGSETAIIFSLSSKEVGKYISFEVTPVASTGSLTGTSVESSKQGPIVASSNAAPIASSVSISGTFKEGQTLTGVYTYSDSENNPEGSSTFKWYRSNDGAGTGKTEISGATNQNYLLTIYDAGKFISFEITPVASTGTVLGIAVESSKSGPVTALPNNAPVATSVAFTGNLIEGQTLTGTYIYSDSENNSEGTSTFKWYRSDNNSGSNKSEISGAVAKTYLLSSSDIGKYISFEVTPVASIGTLTGTQVESSLQGAVVGIPTISLTGSISGFGSISNNTISTEKSYKVSGKNLTSDITVSSPPEFEISKTTGTGFTSSLTLTQINGIVDTTLIYIRFAPTSFGSKSGNITLSSTGATTQNIAVSGTSSQNLPLAENFVYSDGSLLTSNGWVAHSAGGTASVAVGMSNGLEFPGYSGSGTGNAAELVNTGEDVSLTFVPVTSDSLYFSFLVNVKKGTLGYFAHLGASSSTFAARIFVKPSVNSGKINFGISNTSTGSFAVTPTDFDDSTTYLIIVKYNVSSSGNSSMWILSSSVPSSEFDAGTPEITTTGSGISSVDRICLRQYSATENITIDGLRIGTSWNNAPLPVELISFYAGKTSTGVSLKWSTKTETNNNGWEIESRRQETSDRNQNYEWKKIGFVVGKGTTTEAQNYRFNYNSSGLPSSVSGLQFRLKQLDNDGKFAYSSIEEISVLADKFELIGNYPNPFNPTTNIAFNLPEDAKVRISVSNVLGQKISVLADHEFKAGNGIIVPFNAVNFSAGIYFYTITADGKSVTKPMTLLK